MSKIDNKAYFIAIVALICLFFAGCPSPTGPAPTVTSFLVTFDSDGGSSVAKQTVESGKQAGKPNDPQKENWHFAGWFNTDGTAYSFSTPVTADITLKAKWQIIVTFNANGGTLKVSSVTTKESYFDQNAPFMPPDLQRTTGEKVYSVLGWSKKAEATEATYDADKFDLSVGSATSPVTLYAVWTESQLYTVSFVKNEEVQYTSVSVKQGDSTSSPTADPTLWAHYFRFWSKDKTTEYDFSEPVVENFTLYALWAPQIDTLSNLSNGSLEIECSSITPRVSDGWVTATYTTATDSTPQSLELTDASVSGSYITYSFTAFPDTVKKTYTVKITNGRETKTEKLVVSPPSPVTNLTATGDDSSVKLSWTKPDGYSLFDIECKKDGTVIYSEKDVTGTKAVIYGLTNGTTYTFTVTTAKTDKSASVTAAPAITQKESDWLYIMYMDGDNNLNDPIFLDLNEIEYGLYSIRNTDGTPKSGKASVNVVALWDGFAGDSETKPQIGGSGSYLYELGTDYSNDNNYVTERGCLLSSNTKNLSYTAADWLFAGTDVPYVDAKFYGEVNMGDKQTLINFLNWAKERYTAPNIVVQFSNHGGGPRSAPATATLEDGRTIRLNTDYGRKALCWDDNSGPNAFLKTKDVSEALTAVGYGSSNKLGMILMDVCLGASIEDAYQFKDYASYFAASPNNIPGMGLDYVALMESCTSTATLESVGNRMVLDYKAQYKWDNTRWNKLITDVGLIGGLTAENLNKVMWFSDAGIPTFSFIDLTKMGAVKTAIDNLATLLLNNKGKEFAYTENGTSATVPYLTVLKDYVRLSGSSGNSLYYMGTFSWLLDIGYIAKNMAFISAQTINEVANSNAVANNNAWIELETVSNLLLTTLQSAIVSSWRDAPFIGGAGLYPVLDSITNPFGLAISGETVNINGGNVVPGKTPDFYKTDLAFGRDSKWTDLLVEWFGN